MKPEDREQDRDWQKVHVICFLKYLIVDIQKLHDNTKLDCKHRAIQTY